MSELPEPTTGQPLTRALANPLRARLLFEYQREAISPSRLAARLGRPLNLVSYHTNVLVELGCIALTATASKRGATEHFYTAVELPIFDDDAWAELPLGLRRSLTSGVLASAVDDARRAAWNGGFDGARTHLSRILVELDGTGEADVARLLRQVLDEVSDVDAACRSRGSDPAAYELVILLFER